MLQSNVCSEVWDMKRVGTLQAGAALHSVCFFSIAQPTDVEAEGLNVIDPLCHHQVLMHQIAAVRARLKQKGGIFTLGEETKQNKMQLSDCNKV